MGHVGIHSIMWPYKVYTQSIQIGLVGKQSQLQMSQHYSTVHCSGNRKIPIICWRVRVNKAIARTHSFIEDKNENIKTESYLKLSKVI